MKFISILCLALMSAGTAAAEKIDLSTQTCQQFLGKTSTDPDEVKSILIWLDAYYRDEDDPPVIDTDKFVDNAKKLALYCKDNPSIGLITASDKLFERK